MKKGLTPQEVAALIPDGASLMIGGFMGVGSPLRVIDALVAAGRRDLTLIANDTAKPDFAIGRLIRAGAIRKAIVSHIGLNPETQRGMIEGAIDVELVPQGTLAEQIRAGGYGLGGVLTKTGLGTIAAEGKRVIEIDGEPWLYAPPLRADFALICCDRADYNGNCSYQLTATNFNPVMATAAKTVICEPRDHRAGRRDRARQCHDARRARPLSGAKGGRMSPEEVIQRRVARELKPHTLVNLGIGLPTGVAHYIDPHGGHPVPVGERHRRHGQPAARGHGGPRPHRRRRPFHHRGSGRSDGRTRRCRSA